MNSKLEEKLMQYEKNNPITNKQELLQAVESILKEEESKKANKQDIDLIDEAVDIILTLNGVDIENLNRDANVLTHKILNEVHGNSSPLNLKKQKRVCLKWLIPVAAILSLLISATIVAYAMGYDVLSMTNRSFKQLKEKIWYNNNDTSIIISNDNRIYKDVEEMIEKEAFENLLWPSQIDGLKYEKDITVADYGDYLLVMCAFDFHDEIVNYSIKSLCTDSFGGETPLLIGGHEVYLCEIENMYQADIINNNNLYTVTSSKLDTIESFIKILEEK